MRSVIRNSNFALKTGCDGFDSKDLEAKSQMNFVQHVKEAIEMMCVHFAVGSKRSINIFRSLAYGSSHVEQLLNQTGGRNFVQRYCIEIGAHLNKEIFVEMATSGRDVAKCLSIPFELFNGVEEDHANSRCNNARRSRYSESLAGMVYSLQPTCIFKLSPRLGRRNLSGCQNRQDRADCLNPSGKPVIFIGPEIAQARRYQYNSENCDGDFKGAADVTHLCSESFYFGIVA